MKSRALWLLCGDDNTPFFHKYVDNRKFINSICKIVVGDGNMVEGFEAIAEASVKHFETLFQEETNIHLQKVFMSAGYFPTFITEEENEELIKPVTLHEIQSILTLSKNDKSLGPNGLPVKVYRALFDVLGMDLLRVIENSRKNGKIPTVYNSTFLVLIPKTDQPICFEDFKPISLCNYCYKIIGQIIYTHIRKVLGHYISCEQFGFLPRRQIHDAVGVIQEGLHTIHCKHLNFVVLKIDLSKAYD